MAFNFLFGGNTGQTPEGLARRRAYVNAMLAQAIDGPAPQSPGEALLRFGTAVVAGIKNRQLDKDEQAARGSATDAFNSVIGSFEPGGVDTFTTGATGAGATVGGSADADMSGNQIFSGFMDTLKQVGLTNPNALAALASTGKHESGFSPGNVYRAWNDPSESGEAGTSGGLLSWRGPRFAAMRSFVAANGGDPSKPSPELQARYFLQENPQLTTALNNAKSPEEAQQLMNSAWKFAGWNRPGGEAANRISTARSFAGQFGSGAIGPQASADDGRRLIQVADLNPDAIMADVALGGNRASVDADPATNPALAALIGQDVAPTGRGGRLSPPSRAYNAFVDDLTSDKAARLPLPPAPLADAAFAARAGGAVAPLSDAAAAARMGALDGRPRVTDVYGLDPYAAKMPVPIGANAMSGGAWLGSPALRGQGPAIPGGGAGAGSPLAPQFASLPDQAPVPGARPPMPLAPQQFDARAPMPAGNVAGAGPFLGSPQLRGAAPDARATTASLPSASRSYGYPNPSPGRVAKMRAMIDGDAGPQYQQGFDRAGGGQRLRSASRGTGNLFGIFGTPARAAAAAATGGNVEKTSGTVSGETGPAVDSASSRGPTPQPGGDSAVGDMADLYAIMADPLAYPQFRTMAANMIQKRIEQADPEHQLGLDLKRAQIAKLGQEEGGSWVSAGEGYIANTKTGEFKPSPGGLKTGTPTQLSKLIAERSALPADDPQRAVYDQAIAKEAAGSGMSIENTPDGGFKFTQGAGASGKGDKLTEAQSKDVVYWTRGSEANKQLTTLDKNLPDFKQANADIIPLGIGNYLKTPAFRQAKNAADQFLTAVLRKDTGAAITDQEFKIYGPMFLPIPGDDAGTITQKRRMRGVALLGIRSGLGTADAIAQANATLLDLPDDGSLPAYDPAGGGAPDPQSGVGRGVSTDVPEGAADMLRKNPSLADQFDQKYGAGASARVLGGR